MADTTLQKTGLHKSDTNDLGWGARINTGFDTLEARVGLTFAGNPQSHVVGSWYGQTCWDSLNGILYACVGPGDASSASWAPFDPTPIGTFGLFMRAGVPAGWLICDGTTLRQSDFPDLSAVLPTRLKVGLNFTLPNLNELLSVFVGTGTVSAISGSTNTSDGGAFDTGTFQTGVVTNPPQVPSVGAEIGYEGEYANIRVNGYANGIDGNPSGSGVRVDFMQYINFIKPQTARVQATAHQHVVTPRGITLLAGVKY